MPTKAPLKKKPVKHKPASATGSKSTKSSTTKAKKAPAKESLVASNASSAGSKRALPKTSKNTNLSQSSSRPSRSSSNGGVPSRPLILIWGLVFSELMVDLVTTIISFAAALTEFNCCDVTIDFKGSLVLSFTIPFFVLILIEVVILGLSIKNHLAGNVPLGPESSGTSSVFDFLGASSWQKCINFLLLLNPFFGFLVAWLLLYQSSRRESLAVLGLEATGMILHYASIYLEGQKQTWVSLTVYSLPLLPFLITVIVVLVYLNLGGVCYLVEDELFWYQGCRVCLDGMLPDEITGICADGSDPDFGKYCSDETNFCWFPYSES